MWACRVDADLKYEPIKINRIPRWWGKKPLKELEGESAREIARVPNAEVRSSEYSAKIEKLIRAVRTQHKAWSDAAAKRDGLIFYRAAPARAYRQYLKRNRLPDTAAYRRHFCLAYSQYRDRRFGKGLPLLKVVPEPMQVYPPGVPKAMLDKVIEHAKAKGFDDPLKEAVRLMWAVMCHPSIIETWTVTIRGGGPTLHRRLRHHPSITRQWTIKDGAVGLRRSRAVWARFQRSKPPSLEAVDEATHQDQHDEHDHPCLPSILDTTPYIAVHRTRRVDKGAAWRCSVWPTGRKKYDWARPRAGDSDAQWAQHLKTWECVGWTLDEGQVHWTMTTTDLSVEAMARSLGMTAKEVRTINQQAIERLAKANRNELIVAMLAAGASYKQVQEATGLSCATVARIRKQAREAEADVRIYPAALELRFEPFEQIIEPWAFGWEYDEKARATTKFRDNARFSAQTFSDLPNSPGCRRFRFMEDDMPPPPPEKAVREAPMVLMLPDGRVIGTRDGIRFMRPASAPDERDPRIVALQKVQPPDDKMILKRVLYGTFADEDDDGHLDPERPVRQDDGSWLLLPSQPRTRAVATMLRLDRPYPRRRP
jgi:hypothetical protein